MNRLINTAIIAAIVLLSWSCRKDLCHEPHHPHDGSFRVIVDYSQMDYTPSEMRVDFYSLTSGTHFIRFVTPTKDVVSLPTDHYSVVVFNDNSDYVTVVGDGAYNTIKSFLPPMTRAEYNMLYAGRMMPYSKFPATHTSPAGAPTIPFSRGTTPSYSVGQPDLVFDANTDEFEVTGNTLTQTDLHVTPVNITVVYHIRVQVTGMQYVSQARGTLRGGSEGKTLHDMRRTMSGDITIMFDCLKGTDNVSTDVTAFGLVKADPSNPDVPDKNTLLFEFKLINNTTYSASIDITSLLTEDLCANGGTIDLTNYTITIPPVEGGGFNADLGDWYDEDVVNL